MATQKAHRTWGASEDMRRNTKILIGAIIVATIAVMAMTMGSATTEHVSPGELTDTYTGEDVIVEGQVTDIDRSDGVSLTVVGNDSSTVDVRIPSDMSVPPTLEMDRVVVVKGTYTGSELEAYDITVRAHQSEGQN